MIRLIDALLEGFDADTTHGVEETLVLIAPLLHVHLEQLGYRVGDRVLGHRGTDHLAQRGRGGRRAADRDLIPLLAVLIDAEDADVADMMVPTGIHAA